MNGIVTTNRFARVTDLPLSFAQTDLRAGKQIVLAKLPVALNQRLVLRALTLSVTAILTPGIVPVYLNTAMGLCSVGLYRGKSTTGPLAFTKWVDEGTTVNPFMTCVIETPGTYQVVISNNTTNTDIAVTATGSVKLYY